MEIGRLPFLDVLLQHLNGHGLKGISQHGKPMWVCADRGNAQWQDHSKPKNQISPRFICDFEGGAPQPRTTQGRNELSAKVRTYKDE